MMHKNFLLFTLAALAVTLCFADDDSEPWNYVIADKSKGPDSWSTHFEECGGSKNSPIDLPTSKDELYGEKAVGWDMHKWNKFNDWTVLNNHYTVKFSLENEGIMTTKGGALGANYEVLQFHLHWGANNRKGSEHLVDGKSYPMELHFVHKNEKFTTVQDAVSSGDSDAFAALGFFFELQEEDNPDLDDLVEAVKAVRNETNYQESGVKVNVSEFVSSASRSSYYRYFGGLTTPGCQEIVLWTVFTEPIGISADQMEIIRTQDDNSYGVDFFREVQLLGSRPLTLYDTNYSPEGYLNSAETFQIFNFLTFISLLITRFF
ncbi:Car15 [Bugula neritina]|uniref:Carbonic anhydrase n=1 Tax=Bugula neritina TaxID=10212 RepID=A0A7J7K3H7_BUGNE|nr:Car15 [Bugula neritina]